MKHTFYAYHYVDVDVNAQLGLRILSITEREDLLISCVCYLTLCT
jgi:hypothetical protein